MRRCIGIVGAIVYVLTTSAASCQPAPATPLPPVEVTSTRLEEPVDRSTSAVTVITAKEIAQQQAVTVTDV